LRQPGAKPGFSFSYLNAPSGAGLVLVVRLAALPVPLLAHSLPHRVSHLAFSRLPSAYSINSRLT